MLNVQQVTQFLEELYPLVLAESWDNVGLLVGDPLQPVRKVMTCLTVTPSTVDEAIAEGADLIVTHHPLPFRPVAKLTTESLTGQLLWRLMGKQISVYSPHTAFDSATTGINQQLADLLKLGAITALVPHATRPEGAGRQGVLPTAMTLDQLRKLLAAELKLSVVPAVPSRSRLIRRVGIACGSGGDFLSAAVLAQCDALITGEARFHVCVEAEALGMGLVMIGHFASERGGVVRLAEVLAARFEELAVWAAEGETDPIQWD